MAALRHSLVMTALTGIFWGWIVAACLAVSMTLFSGQILSVDLVSAGAGGLGAAAVYHFWKKGWMSLAAQAVVAADILVTLDGNAPLGASLTGAPGESAIIVVVFGLVTAFVVRACLAGMPKGVLSRSLFETHLIRSMIGFGYVFFTAIVLLPFYIMLMTSLKSQQSLMSNPLDYSINLGAGFESLFRSYIELFAIYDFGTFLMNTAFVSVMTVAITLLFCVPGAYAVARLRFRGRKALSRSILMIYMVPAIVLVIPLYAVFSQLGLRNTHLGLLIVYPATTVPVALYMLQGYFKGLPFELEEAGLMDGLNRWQVILKITLPLAMPAMATVSLYVFMIAWNEFLFAFMFLDDTSLFTLSRGIVSLNSSEVPRQHLMAGAVIATIPVLVLFLWFERFLVQGLAAGGVKG